MKRITGIRARIGVRSLTRRSLGLSVMLAVILTATSTLAASLENRSWTCIVYPGESRTVTDAETGIETLFVTTHESSDTNLYFHQRSWIGEGSMLIFVSSRFGASEPMGYIEKTGELVRLYPGSGKSTFGFTAGKRADALYLVKDDGVYEWAVDLSFSGAKTKCVVTERSICAFPNGSSPSGNLNENADGSRLSLFLDEGGQRKAVFIDKRTGAITLIAKTIATASHLQCSWNDPNLVMYAGGTYPKKDRLPIMSEEEFKAFKPSARLWFANSLSRSTWPLFYQRPGELVTHECWWRGGRITFCGGFRPEESHVKIATLGKGEVRIIGAGSWWPTGTPSELSKLNWWHAAGSPVGDWIAADNWHGDVVLFNAKTTEMKLLVTGHRTYGSGAHPHVGWGPQGKKVVFASNQNGNPDVCIAYLP